MPPRSSKRIALLGLLLESNRFAPVTVKEDYLDRVYLVGDEILTAFGRPESELPAEILGFHSAMDAACAWTPVPILVGLVEAGGPLDHAFFHSTVDEIRARLQAALPVDGVYIANHGAMITIRSPNNPRHGSVPRPPDAPVGPGSMAFDVSPVPTSTDIDAE